MRLSRQVTVPLTRAFRRRDSENSSSIWRSMAAPDGVNPRMDVLLSGGVDGVGWFHAWGSASTGKKPTAKCVVSTKRKQYDTIPDAQLLTEIAKRVSNTKNYLQVFKKANQNFDPETEIFNYSLMKEYSTEPSPREVGEKDWFNKLQPLRTDMEFPGKGSKEVGTEVEFIDVEIA